MAWQTEPARRSERRSACFARGREVGGVAAFGPLRRRPLTFGCLVDSAGVGFDLRYGVLARLALRATFAGRLYQCRGVELLPLAHSARPRGIEDD